MRSLLPCLLLLIGGAASRVNGQFHRAFPSTGQLLSRSHCLLLPDGGMVNGILVGDTLQLHRTGPTGTVLWSRGLHMALNGAVETLAPEVMLRPDGLQVIGHSGFTTSGSNMIDPDTTTHIFTFARLDLNGEFLMDRSVQRTFIHAVDGRPNLLQMDAVVDAAGNVVVVVDYEGPHEGTTELMKLTSSGDLLTGWTLGVPNMGTTPFATLCPVMQTELFLTCDGEGNIFIGRSPDGTLRLAKLSGTGDLLWYNSYDLPPGNSNSFTDIKAGTDGRIHAVADLGGIPPLNLLLTMANDGTVQQADKYGLIGIEPGGRKLGVSANDHRYIHSAGSVLHVDATGAPVEHVENTSLAMPAAGVVGHWPEMDVRNGRYAMAGILRRHVEGEPTDYHETIRVLPMNELASCLLQPATTERSPVQPSELTVMAITDENAINIPLGLSNGSPLVVEELPTAITEDLCGLMIGIPEQDAVAYPLTNGTLFLSGDAIDLLDIPYHTVQAITPEGRVFDTIVRPARSIGTTGWLPGMYILRGLDRTGHIMAVQRIVIG
jgi:hypothetical protein